MAKSKSLSLPIPQTASPISSAITSPSDSGSRKASPSRGQQANATEDGPQRQASGTSDDSKEFDGYSESGAHDLTSLPPIPSAPKNGPRHGRDHSRSLFANLRAAKSSSKLDNLESTIRQVSEDIPRHDTDSGETTLYSLHKSPGSTPDLSLSTLNSSSLDIPGGQAESDGIGNAQRPSGPSILSDTAIVTNLSGTLDSRKHKPRFAHLLSRTRSIRTDDTVGGRRSKPTTPIQTSLPEDVGQLDGSQENRGLKTAPLDMDSNRSFRDLMGSASRNKSADRQPTHKPSADQNLRGQPTGGQRGLASSSSTIFRDGVGSKLFANIRGTSSKAADGINKAGKGIFTKMGRSGSSNAREEAGDAHYQHTVINLPLVPQTRRTRIARRLEDSRDKTEFWMPALPWRCIDYLNFRGCEEEGLYRVPGSGTKIKYYQERFDRELDIDLLKETDLYDINIIGSLFKAWLRDLPSEILPKASQARVAAAHPNATTVPQMLKDELSNLPPWNYYLLFAITCHLSLLHAYHDKNKMSYSNLCICFQPCIGIDSYCFQFLVCEWRSCWQGCFTEKEYLEQEYRVIDGFDPDDYPLQKFDDDSSSTVVQEENTPQSSSSSSRPSIFGRGRDKNQPPPSVYIARPSNEHSEYDSRGASHTRSESQLPELQPILPLGPMAWEQPTRNQVNTSSTGA
ncbi:MAG: hypothetical protein L6R42_002438 [Xanthoria sp. 1 TBL-2021]|nr:MAG: hypothetical protein L6R42_002438 [Xanthoria sp. 1 TBL-2021]